MNHWPTLSLLPPGAGREMPLTLRERRSEEIEKYSF
jgi:hypothetical protein